MAIFLLTFFVRVLRYIITCTNKSENMKNDYKKLLYEMITLTIDFFQKLLNGLK